MIELELESDKGTQSGRTEKNELKKNLLYNKYLQDFTRNVYYDINNYKDYSL